MMLDLNGNLQNADGKHELEVNDSNLENVLLDINNTNAEESEDESNKSFVLEMKDYETLNFDTLVEELDFILTEYPIASIKNNVDEIKKAFTNKYNHLIEEKKDEYIAENGNDLEFDYYLPAKVRFDGLYTKYKDKKNNHYNNIQNQLKVNLKNREYILNELKELLDNNTVDSKSLLKKVNDIKERWRNAGAVPKDKYNLVFNNYQFHMERFFDHLSMDREMREIEFQSNYDQKVKIINRVKELVKERDVLKAFKELQTLHRIWKEEIGPVTKEKSDDLWLELSELSKKLHEKREEYYNDIKNNQLVNLTKRKAIIANIQSITSEKIESHADWQTQINRVEVLHEAFINAGRVPNEYNDSIWEEFKQIVKAFNANKNIFYKNIKKSQQSNLNQKMLLLEKAKKYASSDDFNKATPIMKQIQEQWKNIGHVPKKYSDNIWNEFREACNLYFDRLSKINKEKSESENDIYERKKQYLIDLKSFQLVGDHKQDLQNIKQHIQNWKEIGKVSHNKRHIESKFNKILDHLFDKLTLSKKDMELERFNTKIEQIVANKNSKQLTNEIIYVQRKLDDILNEIFQLENNIQFITNAKNDNPLIKEINKNIEKLHEDLNIWKEKLNLLREISF